MPKVRPFAQKRKRRVHLARASPFPIPLATVTGESASSGHWLYYTGTLGPCSVVVHHSGDMDFLYRMGFFGKGEMSRGQPQWRERCRTVTLPADTLQQSSRRRALQCRVMCRRQYITHLKLRLQHQGRKEELKDVCEEENDVVCEKAEYIRRTENITEDPSVGEVPSCSYPDHHGEEITGEEMPTVATTQNTVVFSDGKDASHCHSRSTTDSILASWDDADPGSADFWGTNSMKSPPKLQADSTTCAETDPGDRDFWSEDTAVSIDNSSTETCSKVTVAKAMGLSETKDTAEQNSCKLSSDVEAEPVAIVDGCDEQRTKFQEQKTEQGADSEIQTSQPRESSVMWSRFCEQDTAVSAEGELVFVTPDSDEDEWDSEGRVYHTRTRWKPVLKQDPFPMQETLHLSFEEAFFLSFGLGCLRVVDSEETCLDLTAMWREFCKRQPSFLPNYIAYHYFRSKNWVPKPGLKFGCDFLLYKDGPPFYHGSYSVVVKFVDTCGEEIDRFQPQRRFSWTSLAGLKRITEHVGKELMFCYVIKPRDLTAEDMMSPKCISCFQVKEVLVSRWVSSQERENKGLEEIP